MPKPLRFPTKVLIGFNDEMIDHLDEWRRQQEDLPNRSEAIRRLVARGLLSIQVPPEARRKPVRKVK